MSDTEKFSCPRKLFNEGSDTWRNGACSYCGSMHPDMFMERALAGTITLGPTDKSYKVYVKPEDATELLSSVKFYFHHLSEEQMDSFLVGLNAKKFKIGYPGYFYTLPFFLRQNDQ